MTKIEISVDQALSKKAATPRRKPEYTVDDADDSISISILNDGKGIPVEIHPKENIYIPELIFGHLLTGSNFNDESVSITCTVDVSERVCVCAIEKIINLCFNVTI